MQISGETVRDAETQPRDMAVESVLYALMTIGRLLRQRMQSDGVDPSTFWLLKGLSSQGSMRVTELATLASLDASTVSRHLQQLQRAGLIERTQDPNDGRAQRVALSAEGRHLLDQGAARRRELLSSSLADWNHHDLATFDVLLTRFVSNIERNTELEQA